MTLIIKLVAAIVTGAFVVFVSDFGALHSRMDLVSVQSERSTPRYSELVEDGEGQVTAVTNADVVQQQYPLVCPSNCDLWRALSLHR